MVPAFSPPPQRRSANLSMPESLAMLGGLPDFMTSTALVGENPISLLRITPYPIVTAIWRARCSRPCRPHLLCGRNARGSGRKQAILLWSWILAIMLSEGFLLRAQQHPKRRASRISFRMQSISLPASRQISDQRKEPPEILAGLLSGQKLNARFAGVRLAWPMPSLGWHF